MNRSLRGHACVALIAAATGFAIAATPRAAVAQSGTVYVDDSYSGTQTGSASQPFRTIQAAVNAAAANATIAIAGGTYSEAVNLPSRSLTLNGGYAAGFGSRDPNQFTTRIQGTSANAVVRSTAGGVTYTLDGLTLSGGQRGVWFDSGGTMIATIANCVIENNGNSGTTGGGAYMRRGTFTVRNSIVRNNVGSLGAGLYMSGSLLTVTQNTIEGNIAHSDHGGGMYLIGPGTVSRNIIRGNEIGRSAGYGWGGGMIIVGTESRIVLSYNIITDNLSALIGGGVFVDDGADVTMDHDLVYRNRLGPSGRGGAGIEVDGAGSSGSPGSILRINQCTVVNNTGGFNGGNGVYIERSSRVTVTNSIFWGNGGDDFYTDGNSTVTVLYSLTQENVSGTGVIHADPLFVNSAANDYRLQSNSPARDAADPSAPFDQEPAPNGSRADMGAYGNVSATGSSTLPPQPPFNVRIIR